MKKILDVQALAVELGLSVSRVHQLRAEGMPRIGRAKYDGYECLKWLCRFQREVIARRETLTSTKSGDQVRHERAALLRVQSETQQLELATRRGELIPISVFRERMGAMIMSARQQLLQLPARVAPSLEGEPRAVIKHKLTEAVHSALASLASGPQGEPEADEHGKANGSTAGTAAPASGATPDGKT